MGTLREDLMNPSTQSPVDPVKVDLRHVVLVGMALWTVGLIVVGVLALTGRAPGQAVAVCVAGLVLGVLALLWTRSHTD
ncbi:DUF2530 domain-containing protein [Cellulomonas soli]|uniref:DUF2530 domain-containing protein n=1 Tax=Cellulomonas soli TaxID=931535 RepID=UPI003F84D095